ncbi:hypothetical protein IQ266_09565 [filamentous cyanobacterium LEGE 11480]|uniref:Uncharacterized protein n=1 Tax=Romeriopsis navalis LEGE 11480 TaxID=2777977 RepID=A0A928Z453_9CYAN|nr:hypothetical protein [Romeriopsis navalis]MBE9029973.1 hypothetical protein [Romeriopsis navalis LEGE 11480]
MKRRITPIAFTGLILLTLGTTACGQSRKVQCQRIGQVVNATSLQFTASRGFTTGIAAAKKAAADLNRMKLDDRKLSNLRSHMAAGFQKVEKTAEAMAEVADAQGSVLITPQTKPISQQYTAAMQNLSKVVNASQTYCTSGTAPQELTDKAATI